MNNFNCSIKNIILIYLTVLISFSFGIQDWSEIVKKAKPALVRIRCLDDKDDYYGGSGFVINERGDIVTCYHVMKGVVNATVFFFNDKQKSVVGILAVDSINDIAILRCEGHDPDISYLELDPDFPAVGEPVIVIGSPLGFNFSVTDGIVSAIRERDIIKDIQLNAAIAPGSSGSPVINKDGRVIGVITSSSGEDWYLMNFATPSSIISDMNMTFSIDIADWAGITGNHAYFMILIRKRWENNKQAVLSLCRALEDYFDMAESFGPERSIWANFYYKLGDFYNYLDFYEKAISLYKQAVDLDESCKEAHKGLGDCYFELEKYYDAEESYWDLTHCDPQDWYAQYRLGLSNFVQGYYRSAIVCFKKTLLLYPGCEQAHYNLGKAYLAVDDVVSALEEYNYLHDNHSELALKLFDLIFKYDVPLWKKQYKNFFEDDR
jgi:hypothetical protein